MMRNEPVIPPECRPGAPDGEISDELGAVVPHYRWSEWLNEHIQPSLEDRTLLDGNHQTLDIAMPFPRSDGEFNRLLIHLVDTIETDPIRIWYDFDRDGWAIQLRHHVHHKIHHRACSYYQEDGEWEEVAFVQSWSLTTVAP